jgi:hypothetical protein
MTTLAKKEALFVYRKIAALQCVPCCGMCGTARHSTKPFWCLGMRLCRHCAQGNLVSSLVLYERYWVTFKQPVQSFRNFVDAVSTNVFYFSTRLTPNQRLEFSCDRMDFPGGIQTVWFFWKPHLAKLFDMDTLEREGQEKHRMACVIRAHARRTLVLRSLRGTKNRTTPTLLSTGIFSKKRDLRCTEFRLRKTELLDKVDIYHIQRMQSHLPPGLYTRLASMEDRITPLLLN